MDSTRVAGILLAGGRGRRMGGDKLVARFGANGARLLDAACANFLDAGLDPVVLVGSPAPSDPRVLAVVPEAPPAQMIDSLRLGLRALPDERPFCFAPADMPALAPGLVRSLCEAFLESGADFLVPVHAGRRGHPAFARRAAAFLAPLGDAGAREVFRAAGDRLVLHETDSCDVLFDVDTPEDLAAAGDAETRRRRLIERGDL